MKVVCGRGAIPELLRDDLVGILALKKLVSCCFALILWLLLTLR
jgi:hypothetical protein